MYILRRLDPDAGVPLPRGQHGHRVQELVQAGQQVVPLLRLVRHVVEHLVTHDGRHGPTDLVISMEVTLDKIFRVMIHFVSVLEELAQGPSMMKRNLVGTGTSVRSPSIAASCRRMKAEKGFSKKSTSPTRMLEASAPFGIFFMKWLLTLKVQYYSEFRAKLFGY